MAGAAASDVEGGQQPVQKKARKHRSGCHTLARPLPAIDTTGVGWYAIVVSLLSTVALIILADKVRIGPVQLTGAIGGLAVPLLTATAHLP